MKQETIQVTISTAWLWPLAILFLISATLGLVEAYYRHRLFRERRRHAELKERRGK